MTSERFEQIKAVAMQMAADIEWADFPTVAPEAGGAELRELLTNMAADSDVHVATREILKLLFGQLEGKLEQISGHQEDELEAAGMVQSSLKQVLLSINPAMAMITREHLLRTKFRRFPGPVMQAPRNAWVPSLGEQLLRQAVGLPPLGRVPRGTSSVN